MSWVIFMVDVMRSDIHRGIIVRGTRFFIGISDTVFAPVGFNYDHDEHYRLLEDYWHDEWDKVETDFYAMRDLGANVIRIHLQVGKFLKSPESFFETELLQLDRLLVLASACHVRIHLVGLGCYPRVDVPQWYEKLAEPER